MSQIVTLTMNPAVDVSTHVGNVRPDSKLRCSRPVREPGGGGLNVARAVTKLGGQALALWTRGEHSGRRLSELLDAENLRHRPIDVRQPTRENIVVFEDDSQQQYRFILPGPELSEEEVARCLEAIRGLEPAPSLLVASGSLPPGAGEDFYARLAETARGKVRMVLDTSGPSLRLAVEAGVFLLKPNLRELNQLTGQPVQEDDQIERASRGLIERGRAEAVVTSLGAGGALAVTAEHAWRMRAPTVPIRSKNGAGDSMVAGITLALARGWDMRRAVQFGLACGSACVMTEGTELCRREDAERLYEQIADKEK